MAIKSEHPSMKRLAITVWTGLVLAYVTFAIAIVFFPASFKPGNTWTIGENLLCILVGFVILGFVLCPGIYWLDRLAKRSRNA
jgi:glycopeptide antibiotics resistance protein